MTRALLILALALSPATASAAGRNGSVILFMGDSLTAGYGVATDEAFPALLKERWKNEQQLTARNAGVSGATTAGVLETLDWNLQADDIALVFLCIGANDGLRGLNLTHSQRNIERIVARIQGMGIPVILGGMQLPSNYGKDYATRFAAMYPTIARRKKLKLMPFLLEGVAGQAEHNLQDGVHPNARGHRIIADNVHAFFLKEGILK